MGKKRVLWLLLDLIFLIVFDTVFVVSRGLDQPASVWIAVAFIHFAYLMLLITPLLIKQTTNSAVLGFPLYSISIAYFLLVLLVGVIFILVSPDSYKASLIICIIITGVYFAMLFSHMIANESTAQSIEQHEIELKYVRESSGRIKSLMDTISDNQLKKKVERLYDILHVSPSKSNNAVRDRELAVLQLIDELERQVRMNDIQSAETTISMIEKTANERNQRLKDGF